MRHDVTKRNRRQVGKGRVKAEAERIAQTSATIRELVDFEIAWAARPQVRHVTDAASNLTEAVPGV